MPLILSKLISILFDFVLILLHNSGYANDVNLTVITSDGGTFDVLQDGQDNDIDFDIQSMNGFVINLDQIGDDNTIDIDVDGRNSNGSSMTIYQSVNTNSYSGSFWCGSAYCTMTVNQ